MFHIFSNIDERRKYGGSAFIELQYCKLSAQTKLKKIVSIKSIQNWKDDSLYIHVDDLDSFVESYGRILNNGTYNNMKSGVVDIFGINYYTIENMKDLVDVITKSKPVGNEKLLSWLKKGLQYNGFYLLGI
ncbi:MAG: hypothetical protein K9L64_04985 [Candidatus Izimaplasma sp.]|nr:hypothetical protein [Candidatus Izimaplasma bacterium]